MRLYNSTTQKIEELKTITVEGVLVYVSKLSNAELVAYGYYRVAYDAKPDERYYDYEQSGSIEDEFYTTHYTPIEKELDGVKARMKAELKGVFEAKGLKPVVDTGLGFSVDGGRANLQDFESGLAMGVLTVRASDNTMHEVTAEQMQGIINAIRASGLSLYQTKWTKESQIDALADVEACKLYEATPYEYTLTQADVMMGGEVGDVVTRYKNNVMEW